jgi:hypothetical protein
MTESYPIVAQPHKKDDEFWARTETAMSTEPFGG